MKKTFCDLCGKEMDLRNHVKFQGGRNGTSLVEGVYHKGTQVRVTISVHFVTVAEADICPQCVLDKANDALTTYDTS